MIRGRTHEGVARAMAEQWIPWMITGGDSEAMNKIGVFVRNQLSRQLGDYNLTPRSLSAKESQADVMVVAAVWIQTAGERDESAKVVLDAMKSSLGKEWISPFQSTNGVDHNKNIEFDPCWSGQLQAVTPKTMTAPEVGQILKASRELVHQYYQRVNEARTYGEETVAALIPFPVPPVKRVQKRSGKWQVWVPESGSTESSFEYQWRPLPLQCQILLDESVTAMRPTVAAAVLLAGLQLRTQPLPSTRTCGKEWRKMARRLRARVIATDYVRDRKIANLVPVTTQLALAKCPKCGQPRGSGGCPRGLGAEQCGSEESEDKSIRFVAAGADDYEMAPPLAPTSLLPPVVCAVTSELWQEYETLGERAAREQPTMFGEKDVSDTPKLKLGCRTHCAWF